MWDEDNHDEDCDPNTDGFPMRPLIERFGQICSGPQVVVSRTVAQPAGILARHDRNTTTIAIVDCPTCTVCVAQPSVPERPEVT